jgi:alkylation response protein AidB-like acyl-CoA dehydrogenase
VPEVFGATPPDIGQFRTQVRQWLAANMEPLAPGTDPRSLMVSDEVSRFSHARALQRALYDAGLGGLSFPVACGGRGWPPEYQAVLSQEAAAYLMPIRFSMPTLGIIAPTILEFGTEEQKGRYIPPMLRGDHLWVQFLSEPTCGSDLAGARTAAVRDGDQWVINGSKVWSSGAYGCDYGICLARTDWDATKYAGLTMFVIKIDQPGVELRRIRQVNGSGEFCQEFFTDLRLTDADVVGEVNGGWTVAARLLSHERDAVGGGSAYIGNVNTQRTGTSNARLVELARAAPAPVAAARRQAVGETHMLTVVGRQLIERVEAGTRTGQFAGPGGAVLKLFRGVSSARQASLGLTLGGPGAVVGYTRDGVGLGVASLMRQSGCLAGGSNEMQRNLISERLLGMPREPAADRDIPYREVHHSKS